MTTKQKRGFAAMAPSKRRAISSMGGKVAHAEGLAHEFTTDEAREAGRKGGLAVSANREHMAALGRAGARKRAENRKKRGVAA